VRTSELPAAMFLAHAATDIGRLRDVNEDAFICDVERGIFAVIDGVGGENGGDVAASIARRELELRLRRETGTVEDRLREAITAANEQILQEASTVQALAKMACVLTVAVVSNGRVVAGHVGDTRLYKIDAIGIRKLTHDHSPVGVLEDQGQLSEEDAMRHPDRNLVFRDVGTTPRHPTDPEFIEIIDEPFAPDAALLLCTDGLTDLVPVGRLEEYVRRYASDPVEAVSELIREANDAGGKDNVTVVFAAGPLFAAPHQTMPASLPRVPTEELTSPIAEEPPPVVGASSSAFRRRIPRTAVSLAIALSFAAGFVAGMWGAGYISRLTTLTAPAAALLSTPRILRVSAKGNADFASIADALKSAQAGDTVEVDSGTYAESIAVREGVTVRARQRRGAILRRPAQAPGPWVAIVATGVRSATVSGFVIRGSDDAPVDYGVWTTDADVDLDDLEVEGVRVSAVQVTGRSTVRLRSSYLHDNPGGGIRVEAGAVPEILHNLIVRNGRVPPARAGIELRPGARAVIVGNVLRDNGAPGVTGMTELEQSKVREENGIQR
jgi:serine/threonine protein phosphatase PrpC